MLLYLALCALPFTSTLVLQPTQREKDTPIKGDVESRIYYGDDVSILDYPFFAGLANCGAVIISTIWVLTAAHCVDTRTKFSHSSVWVGGRTKKSSTKIAIRRIIIHPNYKHQRYLVLDDIALIKLKKPLELSDKVQSVVLPYPQALKAVKDQEVEFIGRGIDETGKMSTHLQKSKMEVFLADTCYKHYHYDLSKILEARMLIEELNKKVICTVREKDLPGICNGDSGSPLVQGNVLLGLASYTYYKHCTGFQDSYLTNVKNYLPWIKNITGLEF